MMRDKIGGFSSKDEIQTFLNNWIMNYTVANDDVSLAVKAAHPLKEARIEVVEVAGKPGYVAVKGKDGKVQRWRQPPGPTNALGQLKFVMYNPQNIYLHDTNAKSRFNSSVRAASHGCIRTKDVVTLATELLGDDGGEWTPDKIQETLASKKSKQANFVKPLPVYIVYFSAAANTDGSIVTYDDMYKRDGKVIAALLDDEGKAPGKPTEKVATK